MPTTVDFFFFYGSIHSYLSVMRIEGLADRAGVAIRWRPFNLRQILREQDNTGFTRNQVRLAYNWRDIERRAVRMGIPFARPSAFPVDPELLGLRVGIIAAQEGWCAEYSKKSFGAWFLEGRAAGLTENVAAVLTDLGRPVSDILARAASPQVVQRVSDETDAARQLGVFGAPTFAVGTEIFWGDDRLEDALDYAQRS